MTAAAMRPWRAIPFPVGGVCTALLMIGCNGGGETGPPAVATVEVTAPVATLHSLSETVQLSGVAYDDRGTAIPNVQLDWRSSPTGVVALSSTGLLTALKNGTAVVSASVGAIHGDFTVVVEQRPAKLAFVVQPSAVIATRAIAPAVRVQVQDALGTAVTGATPTISMALAPTVNTGVLSGTTSVAAVDGEAVFSDLGVTRSGRAYILAASAPSLASATSAGFNVALNLSSISAGGVHNCGLTADGVAYCWGDNASGRVGNGTSASSAVPARVVGGLTFKAVSAGSPRSCGLTTTGAAYCWGQYPSGDGTDENSAIPRAVAGGLTFQSIEAGWHTCALTAEGKPYCWGDAKYAFGAGSSDGSWVMTPLAAMNGTPALKAVTTGTAFTCGLTLDGTAYCAGNNPHGELGNGSTTFSDTPTLVAGGLRFTAIDAGNEFVCGLTTDGAIYCWGDNEYEQLGTTAVASSPIPLLVLADRTYTSLTAGGRHACALTSDGTAYCWGHNDVQGSNQAPAAIAGGKKFISISAGSFHDCGIATDDLAYCWGVNVSGSLGTDLPGSAATPTAVAPAMP